MRWPTAVVVLAATGLWLVACGSENSVSTEGPTTTVARLAADTVTFRPVLVMCAGDGCTENSPGIEALPGVDAASGAETYYIVGPVAVDGSSLESAHADNGTGQWVIQPVFRDGPDGIDRFNEMAEHCSAHDASCPTGQLAIVVDGQVISAPNMQTSDFERNEIQISGNFDEGSATALADRLTAAAGG